MPTELYEDGKFEPSFKFDADLQWTDTFGFQVTKRRVEGKGNISDFITDDPEVATVDGKVTAMTVPPDLPEPEKLAGARSRLIQLAKKMQPVLVLTELDAAYLVISRVELAKGVDDGHSLRAKVGFAEIETTTVGTVQIPASRLRAKVKRRAATGKKGGAAKGSQPSAKDKTKALQIGIGLGFFS